MKKAQVSLHWNLSVSEDVVSQHLTVSVNGGGGSETSHNPVTNSLVLGNFDSADLIEVEIYVADEAGNKSDSVFETFTVPDIDAPSPVEAVNFSYTVVGSE